MAVEQHVQPDRTTPLQSVWWSMALSALMVKFKRFICLFNNFIAKKSSELFLYFQQDERQNHCGPPPEFPLASSFLGITK